jgi:hypothetical protein
MSPKDLLNKLRSNAQTLATFECSAIAEEITRVEAKLFMDIEVSIGYYHDCRDHDNLFAATALVAIYPHARTQRP